MLGNFPHYFGWAALTVSGDPPRKPFRWRAGLRWAAEGSVALRCEMVWGEVLAARLPILYAGSLGRSLSLRWGCLQPVAKSAGVGWAMTVPVSGDCAIPWAVTTTDPVAKRMRMSWGAPEDGFARPSSAVVVHAGDVGIDALAARVSQAEDSPHWQGEVSIAGDGGDIEEMTPLVISFGGFDFALVVDKVFTDRTDPAATVTRLDLLSPIAQLDTPRVQSGDFSFSPGATARRAVESLLHPFAVAWELMDWTLPSAGLLFTGVTPLAAARRIVEAVGGLLESMPDGTVLCRRRHPVVPPYDTAEPDIELQDCDVLTEAGSTDSLELCNRLVISDDGGETSSSDRIEYTADDGNPLAGVVRAWPSHWRPVRLLHTGRPEVQIQPRGIETWSEVEMVEFVDGVARTRYTPERLLSVEWRYQNLGAVTVSGDQLQASGGYSLARVKYETRAYVWAVSSPVDDEVQFVLESA